MPEETKPPGSYEPGLSAKKAGTQTLMSYLAMAAALLSTLIASPDLMAQVLAAVSKYPKLATWTVAFFGAVRFGLAYWKDYQAHKDPAYSIEHGVAPAQAEKIAVASGGEPVKVHEEAKAAVVEQAKEALGRWNDRATERDAANAAPVPVPVVAKILGKILPKRKKKAKGK